MSNTKFLKQYNCLNAPIITLGDFMTDYLGHENQQYHNLTHKTLKLLNVNGIKRLPFEMLKDNPEILYKGEAFLVTDARGDFGLYQRPGVKIISSFHNFIPIYEDDIDYIDEEEFEEMQFQKKIGGKQYGKY